MSIDFYIKGKPCKRKAPPKQKRRKFPTQKQDGQEPRVSDHCLIQYQTRVLEVDTDALRNSIMEEAQPFIDAGASGYTDSTGVRFVIENGVVVTCYKAGAIA